MQRAFPLIFGVVLLAAGSASLAQPVTVKPNEVKWTDMKGMPVGWKHAILAGDPEKPGPYVERIKVPPNASVPPHSHPDTENITVLAGTFGIAAAGQPIKSSIRAINSGSGARLATAG